MLSNPSVLADRRALTLGPANGDVTLYLFADYACRASVAWRQLLVNYASHRSEINGINADSERYARAFGFVGTPTLVIGPYLIAGRHSRERLRQLIDQTRKGAS